MAAHIRLAQHVYRINCVSLFQKCQRCNHPSRFSHSLASQSRHIQNKQLDFRIEQLRWMSGGQRSFIKQFVNDIKQRFQQSDEMKESLQKFREEKERLESSDAIKKARQKFENIEKERLHRSEAFKKTYDDVREKVSQTADEISKSEFAKKSKEITEEIGKTAGKAGETIKKSGQQLGQTQAFKAVSEGVKVVKEEVETAAPGARTYTAPELLHKRMDYAVLKKDQKTMEANFDATGVVIHKDSKWYQSWQNFKDNNQYINKMFDLKMKYDESEHVAVRLSRTVTDKIGSLFGSVFSKSELSEVLTEITKVDPSFTQEKFLAYVEGVMIPNVLESIMRVELDVLKDWCHEGPYNALSFPLKDAIDKRYKPCSRVLDVNNVDVSAGKMMEQGPVLIVTFNAQQIEAWKDFSGKVVIGDAEKVHRIMYVWAICRDQEELDPNVAWKIMEIGASAQEQWL